MRDLQLPDNLTVDELIERQVNHARSLGAPEGMLQTMPSMLRQIAALLGRECFLAHTYLTLTTDFLGAFNLNQRDFPNA